jgi:para-nitrobenzyl esterase
MVLTGTNREESRLFLVAPGLIDLIDEPAMQGAAAAYGLSQDGLKRYRDNRPGASPGDVMAAFVTDWFFMIPAVRHAEAREDGGGFTWIYRFDYPDHASNDGFGASHAVEIPFVFDTLGLHQTAPLIGSHPSAAVAENTHRIWVSFVTTGDPGWNAYSRSRRTVGVITETLAIMDDPDGDERALWDGVR